MPSHSFYNVELVFLYDDTVALETQFPLSTFEYLVCRTNLDFQHPAEYLMEIVMLTRVELEQDSDNLMQ